MSKLFSADAAHRDSQYWTRVQEIVGRQKFGLPEVLRFFPAYTRRRDFTRLFAHYELFKMIENLPGSIVELGVYTGSTLLTWAKLMETFCPADRSRKVYGFDHFAGLTDFVEKDGKMDRSRDKFQDCYVFDGQTVKDLVETQNDDNLLLGDERCRIIDGDLKKTVPEFIQNTPGLRISLLHLDVDLYAPTRAALDHLFPLVLRGGLVVFDEFALPPWEGETLAAEEYFEQKGLKPVIRKFPFSSQPSGYFVKE